MTVTKITINGYDYWIYQLQINIYVVNALDGTFPSRDPAIQALRHHVLRYEQEERGRA